MEPKDFSLRSLLILFFLGVIIYFTGFIPVEELKFSGFVSIYLLILSMVAFPPVTPTRPQEPYAGSKLLKVYVSIAAAVGLLLPLLLILISPREVGPTSAPHTVLLLFQILSEMIFSSSNSISLPVWAFVPIFYNAWRLLVIWSWMGAPQLASSGWIPTFGKIVAVLNMAFWSFNLFCFLLPMVLPLAMKNYHRHIFN